MKTIWQGTLEKLPTEHQTPVRYFLDAEKKIVLNEYLGKTLKFRATGRIICQGCGNLTKKSFQSGFCFPCTKRLACCDLCIVKPVLCHYAKGTCREPKWGEQHCFVPHYLYLANSSGLKVGLTRHTQVPTRFIDQGATDAILVAKVDNRKIAGTLEHTLTEHIADKTDYRKLIKGVQSEVDLAAEWEKLKQWVPEATPLESGLQRINVSYPVLEYPTKVVTTSFEKVEQVEGVLHGIRGQYLFLGDVQFNARKHSGYEVEVGVE